MKTVTVDLEDLEKIVFATSVIKTIESTMAARKNDPFVRPHRLCPTTPFCPKTTKVAQKLSQWPLGFLVALFVVFIPVSAWCFNGDGIIRVSRAEGNLIGETGRPFLTPNIGPIEPTANCDVWDSPFNGNENQKLAPCLRRDGIGQRESSVHREVLAEAQSHRNIRTLHGAICGGFSKVIYTKIERAGWFIDDNIVTGHLIYDGRSSRKSNTTFCPIPSELSRPTARNIGSFNIAPMLQLAAVDLLIVQSEPSDETSENRRKKDTITIKMEKVSNG